MEETARSRLRLKAKCTAAVKAILVCMKRNQIELPSKYQKSRVDENLPTSPTEREAEIMRRLRYVEPEDRVDVAKKLNDLLAYAELGKEMSSNSIADTVIAKLRRWENDLLNREEGIQLPEPYGATALPPPSPRTIRERAERQRAMNERYAQLKGVLKRKFEEMGVRRMGAVTSSLRDGFGQKTKPIILPEQMIDPPGSMEPGSSRGHIDLETRVQADIDKFRGMGVIKKKLHSIPEYERDLKGARLPGHALPLPTRSTDQIYSGTTGDRRYTELEIRRGIDKLLWELSKTVAERAIDANSDSSDDVI